MMKIRTISVLVSLFWAAQTFAQAPDSKAQAESDTPQETTQENQIPRSPAVIDPPVPDLEKRAMALLAAKASPESVVWLQALDEEFLALYEPDITGSPQGAVLILHAEGQHANWPNTIEVMRTTLPEYGWATLATTLPAPDRAPVPKRDLPTRPIKKKAAEAATTDSADKGTPAETAKERPETEEIYDSAENGLSGGEATPIPAPGPNIVDTDDIPVASPAEVRASQRIGAALTYLNDQGQFNIVLVGDGMGAARGGDFVMAIPPATPQTPNEKPIKPIRAMVIINARNSVPASDIDLPKALFDPEIPTLDIYFGTDVRDPAEAERRRKFARRQGFKVYQQLRLPEIANNRMLGENRLARRVRGFLSKHAKGAKVDNAIVIKN
ncbi:alpha/beta hydrolase family protein [Maricurvus nonylphenolicus]|uniref:DUF3530 family protein n=1 Tax=Maricurvus nonylphenolicus TaxID=1008307 RepID=UPI0036F1D053